jgi:hypothetical protein
MKKQLNALSAEESVNLNLIEKSAKQNRDMLSLAESVRIDRKEERKSSSYSNILKDNHCLSIINIDIWG